MQAYTQAPAWQHVPWRNSQLQRVAVHLAGKSPSCKWHIVAETNDDECMHENDTQVFNRPARVLGHIHVCMCTCMHVCVFAYVCVWVCMCVCSYMCLCVCVWVCVYDVCLINDTPPYSPETLSPVAAVLLQLVSEQEALSWKWMSNARKESNQIVVWSHTLYGVPVEQGC